jgi:hypothetical protein
MKKILLILIATAFIGKANAQCATREYIDIANKVFKLELNKDDFSSSGLFVTMDTINGHDKNAPSAYTEYSSPEPVIEAFAAFIKSKQFDGNFFNYYELFDNFLYKSPLHQSFLVNDSTNTYKIDIWNNAQDITKIDGLTISKYPMKLAKTPY